MVKFTKSDRKNRTIMLPQMLEYHSAFLKAAFEASGYKIDIMHSNEPPSKYEALRYISSDYCYPTVLIVGQVLETIRKNGGDCHSLAFMEPQAGGACRAGNIYNLLIETLEKLGYNAPVISLNFRGQERHPGFKITPKLVKNAAAAVCVGDLMMLLYQQTKPYEIISGETDKVYKKAEEYACNAIKSGKVKRAEMYSEIIKAFKKVKVSDVKKKRVGVVGEIYIKYSSLGNHKLEKYLADNGCEVYFGGFANYIIYVADSEKTSFMLQHKSKAAARAFDFVIRIMEKLQLEMLKAVRAQGYETDYSFSELRKKADGIISSFCTNGDGWLIAAEVVQAIENGCKNVLIVHPFGCLVSHVCERGILRSLKDRYKDINIQTIEYDYDQSPTLRESRILLGLVEK